MYVMGVDAIDDLIDYLKDYKVRCRYFYATIGYVSITLSFLSYQWEAGSH